MNPAACCCFFLHVHKVASEISLNTVDLALTSGCRGAPAHAALISLLLLPLLMHQCTMWLEMRWCRVVYSVLQQKWVAGLLKAFPRTAMVQERCSASSWGCADGSWGFHVLLRLDISTNGTNHGCPPKRKYMAGNTLAI